MAPALGPAWPPGLLPSDFDLSRAFEIGYAFQTGKVRTQKPGKCLPGNPVWRGLWVSCQGPTVSVPHAPQGDAVRTDAPRVCRAGLCLRTGTPSYDSGSFWGAAPPGGERGCALHRGGAPGSGGEEEGAVFFLQQLPPHRCLGKRLCSVFIVCQWPLLGRQGRWEPREIQRALVHEHTLVP